MWHVAVPFSVSIWHRRARSSVGSRAAEEGPDRCDGGIYAGDLQHGDGSCNADTGTCAYACDAGWDGAQCEIGCATGANTVGPASACTSTSASGITTLAACATGSLNSDGVASNGCEACVPNKFNSDGIAWNG
eukprot:COSAG01_NODE_12027_length_1813_cov_2.124271_1_plen_132_part_10